MKTKKTSFQVALWAVALVLLVSMMSPIFGGHRLSASASGSYFGAEASPNVVGDEYSASYTVDYDYKVVNETYRITPGLVTSYGLADNILKNGCTAVAAGNLVGYYDRYLPNLIPNFEPGMVNDRGYFLYFPNIGMAAIDNMILSLADLMGVNKVQAGATETDFINGLTTYVHNKGYDISFKSLYSSATNVNLSVLQQMINSRKLGVIFCNEYNFVYSINHNSAGTSTSVSKRNLPIPHAMMVFGYITIDYYKNNKKFLSETFLQVSSGFADGKQGYMKLNDYSKIVDALVIDIY